MKLSELKDLIKFCKDLGFERSDFEQIMINIETEDFDFEVNDYRFIHSSVIDKIQQEELSSDLYILGCFNPSFLANCTDLPLALIEACQKAEAFEALGEACLPYIEKIQTDYARFDGYGHHFSHYDGETLEFGDYFVFRLN